VDPPPRFRRPSCPGRANADGRVSLKNVNGAVHISAWDRNEVQVDAIKRASTQEALNEAEIVTGGDDKHLDFRVLVSRVREGGRDKVVLSTVVSPHNFFGKAYLFLILPFHKAGVKTILSNAVAAGRI
jgi:hypothetical protein